MRKTAFWKFCLGKTYSLASTEVFWENLQCYYFLALLFLSWSHCPDKILVSSSLKDGSQPGRQCSGKHPQWSTAAFSWGCTARLPTMRSSLKTHLCFSLQMCSSPDSECSLGRLPARLPGFFIPLQIHCISQHRFLSICTVLPHKSGYLAYPSASLESSFLRSLTLLTTLQPAFLLSTC